MKREAKKDCKKTLRFINSQKSASFFGMNDEKKLTDTAGQSEFIFLKKMSSQQTLKKCLPFILTENVC